MCIAACHVAPVATGNRGRRRFPPVHVVVVGCGRVGSELAGHLEAGGHSVAVIDKRADAFRRLPPGFRGARVVGFGFDRDHLGDAGIERAGALAAVTSGDNTNILTARIARETFAVEQVVARIYDPRRALIYERLGIPTVATVAWTVDQVIRRLVPTDRPRDWTTPSGDLTVVTRAVSDGWVGRRLTELDDPGRWRLVGVTRFGNALVPTADTVAQADDLVHVAVAVEALDALEARLDEGGD